MTTIFLTNKLQLLIGKNRLANTTESTPCPIGDWNAHVFFVERKKNLIFVNNKSFYTVVIESVKKAELDNIETLFIDRLLGQLVYDDVIGFKEYVRVLQQLSPAVLAKTNNDKRTIGTMNDFIYGYQLARSPEYWGGRGVEQLNHALNNTPTGAGKTALRSHGHPINDMKRLIDDLV